MEEICFNSEKQNNFIIYGLISGWGICWIRLVKMIKNNMYHDLIVEIVSMLSLLENWEYQNWSKLPLKNSHRIYIH